MLHIDLFGKCSVYYEGDLVPALDKLKVQELLGYLIVHSECAVSREKLASVLWGNQCTTAQSKKYLSKALWQLQSSLSEYKELFSSQFLVVEYEWVMFKTKEGVEVDVLILEDAYQKLASRSVDSLTQADIDQLVYAVSQYKGDFLEYHYTEWCQYPREEYFQKLLMVLDVIIKFYEASHLEKSILFAQKALALDPMRELAHRQLMSLYLLAGDRVRAIKQFRRCERILKEELDISPQNETLKVFEQARDGHSIYNEEQNIEQNALIDEIKDLKANLYLLEGLLNKTLRQFAAFPANHSPYQEENGSFETARE